MRQWLWKAAYNFKFENFKGKNVFPSVYYFFCFHMLLLALSCTVYRQTSLCLSELLLHFHCVMSTNTTLKHEALGMDLKIKNSPTLLFLELELIHNIKLEHKFCMFWSNLKPQLEQKDKRPRCTNLSVWFHNCLRVFDESKFEFCL